MPGVVTSTKFISCRRLSTGANTHRGRIETELSSKAKTVGGCGCGGAGGVLLLVLVLLLLVLVVPVELVALVLRTLFRGMESPKNGADLKAANRLPSIPTQLRPPPGIGCSRVASFGIGAALVTGLVLSGLCADSAARSSFCRARGRGSRGCLSNGLLWGLGAVQGVVINFLGGARRLAQDNPAFCLEPQELNPGFCPEEFAPKVSTPAKFYLP